jgi:hypothetical protein
LNELLGAPRPTRNARRDPGAALRAAHRTLRVLARLHLPPWRDTCLYRSVAECLVLRRCGIPCQLRIGVAPRAVGADGIRAHAWVERLDREEGRAAPAPMAALQWRAVPPRGG